MNNFIIREANTETKMFKIEFYGEGWKRAFISAPFLKNAKHDECIEYLKNIIESNKKGEK